MSMVKKPLIRTLSKILLASSDMAVEYPDENWFTLHSTLYTLYCVLYNTPYTEH